MDDDDEGGKRAGLQPQEDGNVVIVITYLQMRYLRFSLLSARLSIISHVLLGILAVFTKNSGHTVFVNFLGGAAWMLTKQLILKAFINLLSCFQ